MTIVTFGRRSPGSGKKPSAYSLQLREVITDVLLRRSMIPMYQIRKEVEKKMVIKGETLKQNMHSLVNSGDVIFEKKNCRYGVYSAPSKYKNVFPVYEEQKPASKKEPLKEGMPHIRRVAASKLPKLSGPIYSPIDWVVHQLQSN